MRLSKRQKRAGWAFLFLITVFMITPAIVWWIAQPSGDTPISDGLTSTLGRNLPDDLPPIRFENTTRQAGIRFKHFHDRRGSRITEDMGSGVAWIDYDNDGWQDLFVVNNAGPMDLSREAFQQSPATTKLYRNQGDGTFEDVTAASGLELRLHGMATAWADFDNDGNIDCLITGYNQLLLFRNRGDGTFEDITERAGLASYDGFWAGATWGDADGDGFVDLYITGYLSYFEIPDVNEIKELHEPPSINPSVFDPIGNLLFINRGDGTFEERSETGGVQNPNGKGLEAAWIDLNGDHKPELYVANDVTDNALYHNIGRNKFRDISYSSNVADYRGSMGIAVGDWDGDQDFDLFVTHWVAEENALYTNLVDHTTGDRMFNFRDEADRYGLGQSSLDAVGWGTFFFDIDNDARLDLFVTNGHTNQHSDNPEKLIGMKDFLYWNRNNEDGFYEVGSVSGDYFQQSHVGRGAAYADYNRDGRLDLFIVNHDGPGHIPHKPPLCGW
ncbi:MAG: FG-GAP repeat domain-containing protein, partial [Bacteroidota bacterium]